MKVTPVEELYSLFHDTAVILQEELDISFLEALAETGDNIFQQDILQEGLSEESVKKLRKYYFSVQIETKSGEEIRKAFQLAILKGMRENVQPNHQMTPDSIGILMAYLVRKFYNKPSLTILDPAVGTGNLLMAVMNHLEDKEMEAVGVDIDDLLLKLAYVSANLQEKPIQFFNQDSLEPLFVDPVDVVVCDLPVGYYPNDDRANTYQLKASKGHSYSHHLFMEQSIHYTKDGGYLFFVVPNHLFVSEEAVKLREFLKEKVYIQAFLQLPLSMFKNEKVAKSILILQKKGEKVEKPKEVLMVPLPHLSDKEKVQSIFAKIDLWLRENKS